MSKTWKSIIIIGASIAFLAAIAVIFSLVQGEKNKKSIGELTEQNSKEHDVLYKNDKIFDASLREVEKNTNKNTADISKVKRQIDQHSDAIQDLAETQQVIVNVLNNQADSDTGNEEGGNDELSKLNELMKAIKGKK